MKYAIFAIKALLTLAFLAAGLSKLAGVEMMVATFDAVGVGQWFRYVTGAIEVVGAVLLWVKGREVYGAGLLTVTMVGAVIAHLALLGPSAVPALGLGLLSATIVWTHKGDLKSATA
jgi:putative oxidoreductase